MNETGNLENDIYEFIFFENNNISMRCLEINIGQPGIVLRGYLEDLKEEGIILERDHIFEITEKGRILGKTKWV